MQRSTESNSRKVGNLKCFQSGSKRLVMKLEMPMPRPSTSARLQPLDKPVIDDDVRDLEPRIAFNLRLIDLVKHRRALYDGRTPGGVNATFRMQASVQMWDGLARQLEYDKGGLDLQKRWKQIRDKYVKERRALVDKERRLNRNPSSPMGNNCSWPLFNKMAFLDPFLVEKDPVERSISPQVVIAQRGMLLPTDMKDFNRRVISAIRARPVLYSKADPGYHNAELRSSAWHAVLSDLNFPCDTNEMQKYWKSLRDRFIRLRRGLNESSSDGSSSSQSQSNKKDGARKWAHYTEMTWLEPHLEFRQRLRNQSALARQQEDRRRRGLVALADVEDGVVVDYEVDREDVEASLLYDEQAELLESGVRFDGDTAYAASVIADIRALPLEVQAHVRARIELALECAPSASELMAEKSPQSPPMEQLQQMIQLQTVVKEEKGRGGGMRGLVKDEEFGRITEVSREEIVSDTIPN